MALLRCDATMSDLFLCIWVFSATLYVFLLGSRLNRLESTMKRHGLKEENDDQW